MTIEDVPVVRGTSLSNYPRLVTELGGDPGELLHAAGIRMEDVGNDQVFIPFTGVLMAIESAAIATAAPDFGRRLAQRQSIEILGPVGVAARTAATLADALSIFSTFMSAYSPAIAISVPTNNERARCRIKFALLVDGAPRCPQSVELSLGVSLGTLRFLMGSDYRPLSVHLPHDALAPVASYQDYFGCRVHFAARTASVTIKATDLRRNLRRDDAAHRTVVEDLNSFTAHEAALAQSVRLLVRQLLPTGVASLGVVADQFKLHPKTLQRRLADEGTTFALLLDQVRKEAAERYLRDTHISLSHLTREVGYAEQSVLTRSCHRWFGCGPNVYRKRLRLSDAERLGPHRC